MKQRANDAEVFTYFETKKNFVNCKICRQKLKFYGTTKNLNSHLERMHPEVLKTEEVHPDEPPTSSEADEPSCSTSSAADAKESNYNKSDRPSRVLPLQAKVAAINLYDKYPEYSIVARHFPCTAQYIEQVIASRDEILEEWNKQTREVPINKQKIVFVGQVSPAQHRKLTEREMKILNNEMDEWIRGCMNEPNFVATDELVKARAIELMKIYNLKNCVPDENWISSFREKYDSKKEVDPPSDAPEADSSSSEEDNNPLTEDEIQTMREYIRMSKFPITDPLNRPSTWSNRKIRVLKLELLYDSVFEWILRMQAKGQARRLDRHLILMTALEANKYVKIARLKPAKNWFDKFKMKYNLSMETLQTRRLYRLCGEIKKHLSLELSDIVEFVKQKRSKHQTVTESHRPPTAKRKSKGGDTTPVDEDAHSSQTSQELDDITDGVADDDGPEKCVEVFEIVDDDVSEKCEEDVETAKGIDTVDGDVVVENEAYKEEYVSRKMKRVEKHDSRDTRMFIKDDEDALRYLKALENFVLLESNFRAIGVISQLEAFFRNP